MRSRDEILYGREISTAVKKQPAGEITSTVVSRSVVTPHILL